MLTDNADNVQAGILDRSIHLPSTARHELIDFIAKELPRWRDHIDRPPSQAETTLGTDIHAFDALACLTLTVCFQIGRNRQIIHQGLVMTELEADQFVIDALVGLNAILSQVLFGTGRHSQGNASGTLIYQ